MRIVLAGIVASGCGSGASLTTVAPANQADPGWVPALAVAPDDVVGWIGVAPAFLPVETGAVAVIPWDVAKLEPGVAVVAVPIAGSPVPARSAKVETFQFGCDNGSIELLTFEGTALASGPVWLVPSPLPAGWAPAAIALRTLEAATERAVWEAGPLTVSLARVDAAHATLTIAAGDRTLHHETLEKPAIDGGDGAPIDLTEPGEPGVSTPVAVFAVSPDGPVLLVLSTSGYEGFSLSTLLVDGDGARPVERLGFYVYQCAF